MMVPDTPRCFPLKSASTMEVSMVMGLLQSESPLNVNCDMIVADANGQGLG
jgi:hypothetical protein